MRLLELPAEYRRKAQTLREDAAAEQAATAWERAAELLEGALQVSDLEALTLEEAEVLGGYTRRHLRRLIREGTIPNAGTPDRYLILRMHVPRKPGHATPSVARGPRSMAASRSQVARAVVEGR